MDGMNEKRTDSVGCPSSLALDAWVLGGRKETDPLAAHVKSCPRCTAQIAELDAAAGVFKREVFPATVDKVVEKARERTAADFFGLFFPHPRIRLYFEFVLPAMIVVLVGAYLAHDLMLRPLQNQTQQTGIKGGLGLKVFVNRGGKVRELSGPDCILQGDMLRFVPAIPEDGYLMVVAVDIEGNVQQYYPSDGTSSMKVRAGSEPLPGSIVMDKGIGLERVFVLFDREPFSFSSVKEVLKHTSLSGSTITTLEKLPTGMKQTSVSYWTGPCKL
jgi:hypothetical protein